MDLLKYWNTVESASAQTLTIHIMASPSYVLELFIASVLVVIYIYMSYEVRRILNWTIKVRPNTVHFRRPHGNFSRESIRTSITRIHKEYCKYGSMIGGDMPHQFKISKRSKRTISNTTKMDWLSTQPATQTNEGAKSILADKLAALTPMQFVKLDKERQLRERQMNGCMQSLTTLFGNVIKNRNGSRLKEQIELAKEETTCSRVSDQVMKYLDSESVTDSLIDVLNDIVEGATVENPLPIKGDVASILYDIGNLKEKSSTIFDTKCDLVSSSVSVTSITKSDVSDHSK